MKRVARSPAPETPAWRKVFRTGELGWRLRLERRALFALRELAPRLHPKRKPLPRHLWVGERGELEAFYLLRRQGLRVVARRWRTPELRGDLDLVAWDGNTLAIVEVKTRTARDLTPAASAVDDTKQAMLRRMARAFRRRLPREQRENVSVRFDLVSVYLLAGGVECERVEGAFALREEREDYFPRRGV